MELPASKADLLDRTAHERAVLDGLICLLPPETMEQPTPGGLSPRGVLAHIAGWEARCTGWIEADRRGETPALPAPGRTWREMDAINAETIAAYADRSLPDLLAETARIYQAFVAAIDTLSDSDLTDPARFAWMKGRPILPLVVACAFEHYEEHIPDVRALLPNDPNQV
jgi:hypothetical protein